MDAIIRVFPRRTKATPLDSMAFIGEPPLWWPEAEQVHVSVTFTWDLGYGERLADAWAKVTRLPVLLGGPATGSPGDVFAPGLYLKSGYVITSRGCPNKCWFCSVPKREGVLRELPIAEGYIVLDDNLLACSEGHVRAVFAMLNRQNRRAEFAGGLEAAQLKPWHVDLLADLKPSRVYFAYDTTSDLEPLVVAGRMLREAGFTAASHRLCCYVLIGYPGDTFERAERRMQETIATGFFPFAMLYRDVDGKRSPEWATFQRIWARPHIIATYISQHSAKRIMAKEDPRERSSSGDTAT
jgi:hypothetical protein